MYWFDTTVLVIIILTLIYIFHTTASLILVKKGRERLTDGRLKEFVHSFTIMLSFIFLYLLWNHFIKIGMIDLKIPLSIFLDLLITMLLLLSILYVSFKIKDLGKTFGLRKK